MVNAFGQFVYTFQFSSNTDETQPLKVRLVELEDDRPQIFETGPKLVRP